MAHIYVVKNDRYNIYSTVVDEFLFDKGISLSMLKNYIKEEKGRRGLLFFVDHEVPKLLVGKVHSEIDVPSNMTYEQYITEATDGKYHE